MEITKKSDTEIEVPQEPMTVCLPSITREKHGNIETIARIDADIVMYSNEKIKLQTRNAEIDALLAAGLALGCDLGTGENQT